MKQGKYRKLTSSLKFKSMLILGTVYLPLSILLIFSMFYNVQLLKKKSYETESQLIHYYIRNLDDKLEGMEDYLKSYITKNSTIQALAFPTVYADRYQLYKYQAYQELVSSVTAYENIDYMYIYDMQQDKCYIAGTRDDVPAVRENMETGLRELCKGREKICTGWCCFEAGDTYLIRTIKYGNLYIGILLKSQSILDVRDYFSDDSNLLLYDGQEEFVESLKPFSHTDGGHLSLCNGEWIRIDGQRYLQVYGASEVGDFYLSGVIPRQAVYKNVLGIYVVSFILLTLGVLLIPICVVLMRREILKPISGMTTVIAQITEGKMDSRVEPDKGMAEEFQLIYDSFNHMMDEIESLQEEVLEKQKRQQKLELLQLQYQIRPHFFLNVLNGIYGLAETGQNQIIQTMVLSLSKYFRYIFGADRNLVRLYEECQYIHSYAEIRKLLQKELLSISIDMEGEIGNALIPPFTIMTFVENSYKHGAVANRCLHISVCIKQSERPGYILIGISDDGKGFSKKALEMLSAYHSVATDEGDHVGIYNVCERLRMTYEKRVFVDFENQLSGGSRVTLEIPLQIQKDEE